MLASIGFVLQIMRFDTAHTIVNRYGMLDFAIFIQMETKRIKLFAGFCSPMNRSYDLTGCLRPRGMLLLVRDGGRIRHSIFLKNPKIYQLQDI